MSRNRKLIAIAVPIALATGALVVTSGTGRAGRDDDEADRAAALEWVDRLGAAGGTNLYDSVQQAFADKDVDTIFV
ncbi:MAG: hypothetical protein KC464_03645, partial [Myxococcales bacterium]|nr:hypothetical protein [Myxococcales bacterium]